MPIWDRGVGAAWRLRAAGAGGVLAAAMLVSGRGGPRGGGDSPVLAFTPSPFYYVHGPRWPDATERSHRGPTAGARRLA